jgi:hypothetical protein
MFVILGTAAFFGVPAIRVHGKPVLGVLGFIMALAFAVIPPLAVFGWRRLKGKDGRGAATGVPPNTSLERTRER